jgi:NTP pyrophosphatase (non-canonical NTP hydrolase)
MIIYISGPMTGYPEFNFPLFNRVAENLRKLGYKIINPAEIEQPILTWESCMRCDIKELMNANKIAVLPGWEKSKGARIEVFLASQLGMEIVDANTLELLSVESIKLNTGPAVQDVIKERKRQDHKWGEQNHHPVIWTGILGEEFGELCQAINETHFDNGTEAKKKGGYENMRAEAIQVAAVAIAFIEMLDRGHQNEKG